MLLVVLAVLLNVDGVSAVGGLSLKCFGGYRSVALRRVFGFGIIESYDSEL